ncbi:MAG: hypothetical protein H7246_12505 [Phycisphaerae bacterium]|nr:hypothetical protein [Saprospiraceae bacterium]
MMKNLLLLVALSLPTLVFAQTTSDDSLGLAIAPGLTPVIANNQTEIGLFNTFVTYRTDDANEYRAAQLTNFLQFQRGMSRQNRLSAGVDLAFSNLRFGPASEVAPFAALGATPEFGFATHTLSAVGLRVRYVPFLDHYEFTVQSSLYFPVSTQDNRVILGEDRTRFSVQGNYATLFAAGWYVVGQVSPQVRISNKDRKQTSWELPLNAYLIRRILTTEYGQRLYVFVNAGYFSSFEKRYKGGLRQVNWLYSAGAGAQWVFGPQWSLSLGWQGLPVFDETIGVEKGTYGALSVGARYIGLR